MKRSAKMASELREAGILARQRMQCWNPTHASLLGAALWGRTAGIPPLFADELWPAVIGAHGNPYIQTPELARELDNRHRGTKAATLHGDAGTSPRVMSRRDCMAAGHSPPGD